MKEEKIKVETTLLEYKREVQNTNVGGAVKEIRMLKEIVKNLEQELLQEKMKRQRGSSRRSHEMRQLMEEVSRNTIRFNPCVTELFVSIFHLFEARIANAISSFK